MPIYEFYCHRCNTIYKFLSRTINTEKIPNCPKCETVKLERRVSTFATISSLNNDSEGDDEFAGIDEKRMERVLESLAHEAEHIDENNPRQLASLMRKFAKEAGINFGEGMEEAIRRMEKGEDPEQIEEELGDAIENEDPFLLKNFRHIKGQKARPKIDDHLYDL
ncbi:regulatory protein, FmdB family [Caldithrix abyssi DSM 13497]|uniref:Regulatory protein, FmdB family n=1 Tax=Caldithrix abyssi DSM 13497 TaxID=880073 RepID=H1XWU2_CALAY|nr:zinc ribbon domain-containing protein [Caldithrix abyssi]APF19144.1 putative regulatory protein, FmdB family [Caldithrix abyssi DSM 13497]EHO43068.1 regulatory protein, FmdB family [Caldithrix abyssi DSM 13497]